MEFRKDYKEYAYSVQWFKLCKKRIQETRESYCNGTFPFRSFSPKVVEFMFKLADECDLDDTVKYTSVELYDRFLSEYFVLKNESFHKNKQKKKIKILKQCNEQSYLRVISCMQLMSKYAGHSLSLKLKDVKAILKRTGHSFTTENVLSSEAEVFRVVGYKLNEPSIFMLVEYFINVIPFNVTDSLYSTCLLLTDCVYIHQQELYDRLNYQKNGYRNYTYIEKLKLLNIDYDKITTAAVVVLTAFYILNSTDKKNEDLCEYLSTVCERSKDDLFLISSILISIINSI